MMKQNPARLAGLLATLLAFASSSTLAAPQEPSSDFPSVVAFELGDAKFAPGDSITIQQVRGTSDKIKVGESYSVEGTYTLASQNEADLALFVTSIEDSGPAAIDPKQRIHVKKGSGSFHLIETVHADGYLHVSFYSGGSLGGVYFGQGNRVLRDKTASAALSLAGPNQAMLEYLGNPVPPPANLDARYTRDGLAGAVQLAARNAGITVKKVMIDDSEFPFLVGVVCGGGDYIKLKAQIRKMDGYAYDGSVGNDTNSDGSDTCNACNIVPYGAYPGDARQSIDHRTMLRQQMFYNKLIAQP